MSFFFTIESSMPLNPAALIDEIGRPDVAIAQEATDDHGTVTFACLETPGASTRGVTVLSHPTHGIEIGVNAFATEDDAKLCLDAACALAEMTGQDIAAESGEVASAEALRDALPPTWVAERVSEGEILLQMARDEQGEPVTLIGCQHAYSVDRAYMEKLGPGLDDATLLHVLHRDCIALQDLVRSEEILIPSQLAVTDDPSAPERTGFLLQRDMRTLAQNTDVVFLYPEGTGRSFVLDIAHLRDLANTRSWEYYDAVHFEIPALGTAEYDQLVARAIAEGDTASHYQPQRPKPGFLARLFGKEHPHD